MCQFALQHEFLFFILMFSFICAVTVVLRAFANRNKPVCRFNCQDEDDDDCTDDQHDEDAELIAAGGEEEDSK